MAVLPADARILILRRDNIGDLVCTTPLLAALRAQAPRAWIGALVNTYNAEVLARNPDLDQLFVYEKLKHRRAGLISFVRDRMRLRAALRARQLDAVLVPAPSAQSLKVARSLGAKRIIAAPEGAESRRHEVERSFDTGRELGLEGAPGPARIFPDPAVVGRLRARIGTGPFVAVHVSARRPRQRWPLARYAALLRHVERPLLLWAPGPADDPRHPGDDAAAARLVAELGADKVTALPTPDLATLIAALSLARLVVCPDGGAMHLAAALGKPVVALFGDSPPERWHPWGVPHGVVRPASRDLADLALDPVLEALAALG